MKRFFVITLLVFATAIICSCGTASNHTIAAKTVSKDAQLSVEKMRIWSRPVEVGFQVAGSIEGEADNSIGDPTIFDQAQGMSLNLFSKNEAVDIETLSPLAKIAAFNAIKKVNADGMMITMIKEENNSGVKTAWVKGIALKLVVYDEVSMERSDSFRRCELSCTQGQCQGCFIFKPNEEKEIKENH